MTNADEFIIGVCHLFGYRVATINLCGKIILQHKCLKVNIFVVKNDIVHLGDFVYYNEIIQFERETQNKTQKQVAEYLGIKQQQYARYEKGINLMPITHLKKVCEYLNLSADYVLGLPELPYPKR